MVIGLKQVRVPIGTKYPVLIRKIIYCPCPNYNRGNKLSGQMRKTALCLTPQAMYNQFKRPSAASVSELYYICRKT